MTFQGYSHKKGSEPMLRGQVTIRNFGMTEVPSHTAVSPPPIAEGVRVPRLLESCWLMPQRQSESCEVVVRTL